MANRSFENITIVSVTGSADYAQGSIYAIQRSIQELKGAKGLLISPPLAEGVVLPEGITHCPISPFGYLEYNLFVLYQLEYFIDTDYCIIVQNDGWVLNGENWRDEFWDYDYIGPPLPIFCHRTEDQFQTYHTSYYLDNQHLCGDPHYIEPQNGGFSFRSKKLLGMPRKLNLLYQIALPVPITPEQRPMHKMYWEQCFHYEDIFLTAFHRAKLEQAGIRFAPTAIAEDFAVESTYLHRMHGKAVNQTVGFHFFGVARFIEENLVKIRLDAKWANTPPEFLSQIEYVKLFLDRGYNVRIETP